VQTILVRNVSIGRRSGLDVRVGPQTVLEVGPGLASRAGEDMLDGAGGALIPGLHDHHVHLRAVVAARQSVDVSGLARSADFDKAISSAAANASPGASLRVIGWHETRTGSLDRYRLDVLSGRVPVRVQHRSGALWVLNSAELDRVGAMSSVLPGIERGDQGEPTGRLFRLDGWLRGRSSSDDSVESFARGLRAHADECAQFGVTGWTDATPDREPDDASELSRLAEAAVFRQRLVLMTPPAGLPVPLDEDGGLAGQLEVGPAKIVLDDTVLPSQHELADVIRSVHGAGRAVAIHCVTASQLIVAVAAFEIAGPADDRIGCDRIEHAGVVPPGYARRLASLGLAVVTQPGFIRTRGDDYLREVAPAEQEWLYPAATLMRAGVKVAASTDAPFGPANPWQCIASAVTRECPDGQVVGAAERVSPYRALRMFLAAPEDVRRTRTVSPGQPAELCLLHVPLREALAGLPVVPVRATLLRGLMAKPLLAPS
jgi:predicted amidohydrolase YtcJ